MSTTLTRRALCLDGTAITHFGGGTIKQHFLATAPHMEREVLPLRTDIHIAGRVILKLLGDPMYRSAWELRVYERLMMRPNHL